MKNYESFKPSVLKALTDAKVRTLEAVGIFTEGEAINRSAVDTGNLKGSITHKVEENAVHIGTNVEYGIFVEKGTKNQKAQPFLTPAVEENINKIKSLVSEMMKID